MAGPVPAIHAFHHGGMAGGYVFSLTNRPNGVLYVVVAGDLVRRVYEHRTGAVAGFAERCDLKRLVHFEQLDDVATAIQREHNIKHWSRAWKVRKIVVNDPDWNDLFNKIT